MSGRDSNIAAFVLSVDLKETLWKCLKNGVDFQIKMFLGSGHEFLFIFCVVDGRICT